ncbi:MAG: crossover junction endodeoxyribonuclease RuvC [Gammaproteobacteria bacterium]|nr:crossover junction endodeoxyribonuclease RuvC [Gammaproteobacteria bacterium]
MPLILGIDPGSRVTGYGIVRVEGSRNHYVTSGCIRTTRGADFADRLLEIGDGLTQILREHGPEVAAVERVFMSRNAESALKLGQARGAAILTARQHGLAVAEYEARKVKQAVVGTGAADKAQVQHMIRLLLGLQATPQEDAADALAIAICHAHTRASLSGVASDATLRFGRGRLHETS